MGKVQTIVHMNYSAPSPIMETNFEQQYRQYISIFNGEMKDEHAVSLAKEKFNAIYGNVQSTEYGGYPINRGQIEHLHEIHLSLGSKMTLIHFRKEGLNTVNVKIRVVNKQENTSFHNILTIEDNKIVKVQTKEEYDEEMLDFLLEMDC